MKKMFCIGMLVITFGNVFGQHRTDSIETVKSFGTHFWYNNKKLSMKELVQTTQSNPEALREIKAAKSNYAVSSVLGFAGGFLIGWPIGTALAGGEPKWALAGVGAGLFAVSIPFTSGYVKHAKKGVALYNRGLKQAALKKTDIRVGLAYNGFRVKIMF